MTPRVFSYIVARDYGFAPNPFHGYCTLATCKSPIRKSANVGDFVLGTGSARKGLEGRAVYLMRVAETVTFDEYWSDTRFRSKKPILNGSLKQQYGDNIYHRADGHWRQADSHHSHPGGEVNLDNLENDTKVDRVLVSDIYTYWGGDGPPIPAKLRSYQGVDLVRPGVGYQCNFPPGLVDELLSCAELAPGAGVLGDPAAWDGLRY